MHKCAVDWVMKNNDCELRLCRPNSQHHKLLQFGPQANGIPWCGPTSNTHGFVLDVPELVTVQTKWTHHLWSEDNILTTIACGRLSLFSQESGVVRCSSWPNKRLSHYSRHNKNAIQNWILFTSSSLALKNELPFLMDSRRTTILLILLSKFSFFCHFFVAHNRLTQPIGSPGYSAVVILLVFLFGKTVAYDTWGPCMDLCIIHTKCTTVKAKDN